MDLLTLPANATRAAGDVFECDVVVEIPAHSAPVKYEADKQHSLLRVDRILGAGMRYPCNYGFVPGTHAKDGDPLDALVWAPYPLEPLSVIRCRLIGMLRMTDEHGSDAKLLTVPADSICPATRHLRAVSDLGTAVLDEIAFFFEHYKKSESGKWVRLDGWGDIGEAATELSESLTDRIMEV